MYKKIILLVLLTGTFNVFCKAQNSATNSTATVYLIRSTGMPGNFSAFNAFVDDSLYAG